MSRKMPKRGPVLVAMTMPMVMPQTSSVRDHPRSGSSDMGFTKTLKA